MYNQNFLFFGAAGFRKLRRSPAPSFEIIDNQPAPGGVRAGGFAPQEIVKARQIAYLGFYSQNQIDACTDAQLAQYDYVITQDSYITGARITAVKAINPETKFLLYREAAMVNAVGTSGVTKATADANPAWYLRAQAAFVPIASVLDNFNRTAENPLSDGGNWSSTKLDLTTANLQTNGTQLTTITNAVGEAYRTSCGPACEVYATITTFSSGFDLWLRANSPGASRNGYFLESGSSNQRIYKVINGTTTAIGVVFGSAPASGDTWLFRAAGTTLEVWRKRSGTWTRQYAMNDSSITGGGYIAVSIWNSTAVVDDFGGGSITDVQSTTYPLDSYAFPGNYLMDMGHAGYQTQWYTDVLATLSGKGWAGVFVDDINPTYSGNYATDIQDPEQYTVALTQSATASSRYGDKTRLFLERIGTNMPGYIVVPNISNGASLSIFSDWITLVDGAHREFSQKYGHSTSQGITPVTPPGSNSRFIAPDFDTDQAFLAAAVTAKKFFIPITYSESGDEEMMRYGRAAFLLDWSPYQKSAYLYSLSGIYGDHYNINWAKTIGIPTGAKFNVLSRADCWQRNYSGGTVLLNASNTSQTFDTSSISGYLKYDETPVGNSLTLASGTAMILANETAGILYPQKPNFVRSFSRFGPAGLKKVRRGPLSIESITVDNLPVPGGASTGGYGPVAQVSTVQGGATASGTAPQETAEVQFDASRAQRRLLLSNKAFGPAGLRKVKRGPLSVESAIQEIPTPGGASCSGFEPSVEVPSPVFNSFPSTFPAPKATVPTPALSGIIWNLPGPKAATDVVQGGTTTGGVAPAEDIAVDAAINKSGPVYRLLSRIPLGPAGLRKTRRGPVSVETITLDNLPAPGGATCAGFGPVAQVSTVTGGATVTGVTPVPATTPTPGGATDSGVGATAQVTTTTGGVTVSGVTPVPSITPAPGGATENGVGATASVPTPALGSLLSSFPSPTIQVPVIQGGATVGGFAPVEDIAAAPTFQQREQKYLLVTSRAFGLVGLRKTRRGPLSVESIPSNLVSSGGASTGGFGPTATAASVPGGVTVSGNPVVASTTATPGGSTTTGTVVTTTASVVQGGAVATGRAATTGSIVIPGSITGGGTGVVVAVTVSTGGAIAGGLAPFPNIAPVIVARRLPIGLLKFGPLRKTPLGIRDTTIVIPTDFFVRYKYKPRGNIHKTGIEHGNVITNTTPKGDIHKTGTEHGNVITNRTPKGGYTRIR